MCMKYGRWLALSAMAGVTLATTPVLAQEQTPVPPAAGQSYSNADLARFAPANALDMVSQIPGFSIVATSNGGDRGLGGARENILINGERVAGKSLDAATALSRIPVASVVRIDIVDGASLNVPGLSGQVANVITTDAAGQWTTTVRWSPEWRPGIADNWLNGEISTTGKTAGNSTLTFSLTNSSNRNGHWGPEYVRDADGLLQFIRQEKARYYGDRPKVSGALSRTAANGNKLNLNLAGQFIGFDQSVRSVSQQGPFGTVHEASDFAENEWNFEAGGDYEFKLGGGHLKLIALQRMEHSPTVSTFIVDRSGSTGQPADRNGNRFIQTADEAESIVRGEYRWRTDGGSDWQVALEAAYNTLDVDAEFARFLGNGSFQPVAFGGEDTKVQEKRADLSISYGRALTSTLTLQANVGAEVSELGQTGPDGLTRRFIRPKGKIALAWKATPRLTLNAEIQRRVDQLNFYDFASSVDLANDTGNSGNARLVPPQASRAQVEAVRDFGRYGNWTVALAYARITDTVDQVPLSPTTEGRGNLPAAHFYRVSSKGTLLFDPLGWKGAKLDFDLTLRRNRVRDPLNGAWRDQSFGQKHIIDIALRHDVPGTQWAWGAAVYDEQSSPDYRLDEISHEYTTRWFGRLYVEHKNVAGFKVAAGLRNLFNMRDGFDRTVYADRRDGPVAFTEQRTREFGRAVTLTVTGTL